MSDLGSRLKLQPIVRPLPVGIEYCDKCDYPKRIDGCACADLKAQMDQLEEKYCKEMGGAKAWREYTIKAFKPTSGNLSALQAARNFRPKTDNLFFCGPPGVGKSHLAAIAKRTAVLNNVLVTTVSLDDVYMELRMALRDAVAQKEILTRLVNIPILGLEDVGVEKDTEFSTNFFFQVVDGRYRAQRNGLVITSNYSVDHLAAKTSNKRVTSRLYEMCKIFDLTGERDWRRMK